MTTHVLTVEAGKAIAERLLLGLEACQEPAAVALTLFETGNGRFEVQAHYLEPPDRQALVKLIGRIANGAAIGRLRIERLEDRDLGAPLAKGATTRARRTLSRAWLP